MSKLSLHNKLIFLYSDIGNHLFFYRSQEMQDPLKRENAVLRKLRMLQRMIHPLSNQM
jgi:hypothetical protein